jgi:Na+/melibiose symporter-like transporter
VGGGIAVGPIVTGLLDEIEAWRVFYVLLAVGAVALAMAAARIVVESASAVPHPVDAAGALTLGGALTLTLVALTEGRHGVTTLVAWAAAGAALLWVAFVFVELRQREPMLDLTLFGHRRFVAATVAALGTGVSLIGLMSFACSFFISTLRLSSLEAGAVLLAWSGTSALAAVFARRLPAAISGARQLGIGLLGVTVGELAMVGAVPRSIWLLLPGLLISGVASGVLNAGLGREAVASVPADRAALGSGANNTARYLGSSIGVTLVVIIATASGSDRHHAIAGWNHAVLVVAAIAAATAVVVLALDRRVAAKA